MFEKKPSRREFLQLVTAGALVPLLARPGFASEALSEDDPTAKALGYKADASAVDDAGYKPGRTCANCMQFKMGADGACALFPGKTVSASGWCKAWVKKP